MKFLAKENTGAQPQMDSSSATRASGRDGATGVNSFLGRGCEYDGKLSFEGTVQIDGRFTGEIVSSDVLIIGEGAEVHAEIDVAVVIISGSVEGNITARSRIEMRSPARLLGNIVSPVVVMEEGVFFEGTCRMDLTAHQKTDAARPIKNSAKAEGDLDSFDLDKFESRS